MERAAWQQTASYSILKLQRPAFGLLERRFQSQVDMYNYTVHTERKLRPRQ